MVEARKNTISTIGGQKSFEYNNSSSKNYCYGRLLYLSILRLSNFKESKCRRIKLLTMSENWGKSSASIRMKVRKSYLIKVI